MIDKQKGRGVGLHLTVVRSQDPEPSVLHMLLRSGRTTGTTCPTAGFCQEFAIHSMGLALARIGKGHLVTIRVFSFIFFLTKTLFSRHQCSFVTFSLMLHFLFLCFLSFHSRQTRTTRRRSSFRILPLYNSGLRRYGGGKLPRATNKSTTYPASCSSSS